MRCAGAFKPSKLSRCIGLLGLFLLFSFLFSHEAFGAVVPREAVRRSQSATGATQARHAAAMAEQEKLTGGSGGGASGRGADLRAIAGPKTGNTSYTGFPAGTLPGNEGEASGEGEQEVKQPELVAMVGDPLLAPVNEANVGNGLDRIGMIADHVGYRLVLRHNYRPRSMLEPPYSYYLMNGRRRLKTLFFDHQLKLVRLQ